ncbi:orotidine-5'-phosphate decarboxylase [Waterburya agarophytonicola K14]|uniref:Orotidine 5'-phosphate decarboxylase n=1 Tax=Waterburya agarophytonicola KI4 TaxID=2874699 RepID=A0A964FFP5_9CYAN|nr:orotidine-5'-phosphate decarboxylase [Waterburya agarophytonicola]MCC0177222.1 orotidine-5'-phosphate decarboxylase [Waterburya agarophytonicola KI4]
MTIFIDRLIGAIQEKNTPCIVGLDPALDRMPKSWLKHQGITPKSSIVERAEAIYQYNLMVLDAIADLVPAVKPQSAYYELFGSAGIIALEKTIMAARDRDLLVILDVKRGDIASTATAYAQSYLPSEPKRPYAADAITIVPYLGTDCLDPFFQEAIQWGKGIFVCVKTSNPGASIIQEQKINHRYLYEIVADLIKSAADQSIGESGYSGIGAVVGATYPEAAIKLRQQLPRSIFLVPGVGAQGGGNEGIKACFNPDGLGGVVSSSRAIMYPHLYGSEDTNRDTIRQAAIALIAQVQDILTT